MARILVVDDDARFRQLVTVALRPADHSVLDAGCARDADTILARERVELILIDGLLPDADGSRWISDRRKTLGAPFIFVSAFWKGTRDARQLQADLKPSGFLRKPTTAEQILQEVERVLGARLARCALSGADLNELETMRVEYAASVPGRIAQIRRGLEQLRQRPRDAVLFAETRRHVHEVAGTGGSFGFEELGNICAHLEQALVAWRSTGHASWASIAANDRALVAWAECSHRAAPVAAPLRRAESA